MLGVWCAETGASPRGDLLPGWAIGSPRTHPTSRWDRHLCRSLHHQPDRTLFHARTDHPNTLALQMEIAWRFSRRNVYPDRRHHRRYRCSPCAHQTSRTALLCFDLRCFWFQYPRRKHPLYRRYPLWRVGKHRFRRVDHRHHQRHQLDRRHGWTSFCCVLLCRPWQRPDRIVARKPLHRLLFVYPRGLPCRLFVPQLPPRQDLSW